MYSIVLAAMLTTGGQTPSWHNDNVYLGNCYGGCYGNFGVADCCHPGCFGSCGGNYIGYFAAPGGCYGGYGSYYPFDYSSCGCVGCTGSYGAASPYFPSAVPTGPVYGPGYVPGGVPVQGEPVPLPKKAGTEGLAPTKARLLVEAPADAKLYVDDHLTAATSEHRVYQTPDLEPGQSYYYEVRVEVARDGKTASETKRLTVQAGQEVRADFKDILTTTTAATK